MLSEAQIRACQDWQAGLDELQEQLKVHLGRKEIQERVRRYVIGLLSNAERKNGWQLAETMYEAGPQGMQRLLNSAQWDEQGVLTRLREYIVGQIGNTDGILIVDETGFLKNGTKSAGVARQYIRTPCPIQNQQVADVFA